MPLSSDNLIVDTSCLILLNKINELYLLKEISAKVYITSTILNEYGKDLPQWMIIKNPKDKHYQKLLEIDLGKGEASVIALSLELDNTIILLDDLKARNIAEKLKLKYSGTFGLILRSKQEGIIKKVSPVIDKIKKTNFRFDEKLFKIVLQKSGEWKS